MFLSLDQISFCIEDLEPIHPFYGITYLACKRVGLAVGTPVPFPISEHENEFLDKYFKPDKKSQYFYRVFRTSDKRKHWLESKKYASSTLQSIRTQSGFKDAFIHDANSDLWGWKEDYVAILRANLIRNMNPYKARRIPAFQLAVWLYREKDWPANIKEEEIVDHFFQDFGISEYEQEMLFDPSIPRSLYELPVLQENIVTWDMLQRIIGSPPDAKPEEGGTLSFLQCEGVGPARKTSFEPAERLNLITGDNGLGKTFILECAWWALTGQWAGFQAFPRSDSKDAKITFQISGEKSKPESRTISYDWKGQKWPTPKGRPTIPGLIVYARVDGSFAVWDPARIAPPHEDSNSTLVFRNDDIWDGQKGKIEGLLRDWVKWQSSPEKHPFETFKRVLARLSPPDLGTLEPGEPRRLPHDPREIPTLKHSYGEVPIIYASAGVRRIVTLAYLIVWTWTEHKIYAELAHTEPQRRIVVLIDEMEAHLHPLWQRTVLPALLDIRELLLVSKLDAQFLVATHSPLVMASVEVEFNHDTDRLFHLDLSQNGQVSFSERRFLPYGSIDSWLTSEIFDLRHARSKPAEQVIEKAKALQLMENPSVEDVHRVSLELTKVLPANDKFWPRWVFFAEQHGVKL